MKGVTMPQHAEPENPDRTKIEKHPRVPPPAPPKPGQLP
jgi:hypothetical protein